jgi:hypothetical protein
MKKRISIALVVSFAFAVGFLAIIVLQRDVQRSASRQSGEALRPIRGDLAINGIDDLRVGNRRIVLCGTSPPRSPSVWSLATEAARRDFQGIVVTCNPVGFGTPCDGKTGSKLGAALVVQCLTSDGVDLAAALSQKGLLCGNPSVIGSLYKAC